MLKMSPTLELVPEMEVCVVHALPLELEMCSRNEIRPISAISVEQMVQMVVAKLQDGEGIVCLCQLKVKLIPVHYLQIHQLLMMQLQKMERLLGTGFDLTLRQSESQRREFQDGLQMMKHYAANHYNLIIFNFTCTCWNWENRPRKTCCASGVERNSTNWLESGLLILLILK